MSTAPSMRVQTGRPRMFQDIVAFQAGINAYFDAKDAEALTHNRPPIYTMEGLARALGCNRTTLLNYESYDDDEAFVVAVKSARGRVAEWTEERLYRAGQHPASPIFSLKNNFGWRDEQTTTVNVAIAVGITAGDDSRRGLLPDLVIAQIRPENAIAPAVETTAVVEPVSLSPPVAKRRSEGRKKR